MLSWLAADPVRGAQFLWNDGQLHRIDDATHAADWLSIRNAGCGSLLGPWQDCQVPGAATTLEIESPGEVGTVRVGDSSLIQMNAGTLSGSIYLLHRASLALAGGSVAGKIVSTDFGSSTLSGGSLGGNLLAQGASAASVSGGLLGGSLIATGSSTITLAGRDFAIDGNPVGYGPLPAPGVPSRLTGTLASGDPVDLSFSADPLSEGRILLAASVVGLPVMADVLLNDGSVSAISDWMNSRATFFVRDAGCGTRADPAASCPTPGAPTSLELSAGGALGAVSVHDSSSFTQSAGPVGTNVSAYDSSSADLLAGIVAGDAQVTDFALLSLGGADVRGEVSASEFAALVVTGGNLAGPVSAAGHARVAIAGGMLGSTLSAADSASVAMSAGNVYGFSSSGVSSLTLTGGTLRSLLGPGERSIVHMSGGNLGDGNQGRVWLSGFSSIEISAGTLDLASYSYLTGSSALSMTGGDVSGGNWQLSGTSTMIVVGSGFAVNGMPVGYGPIATSYGKLTGTLLEGGSVDIQFAQTESNGWRSGRILLSAAPLPPPPVADVLWNDGASHAPAAWTYSRSSLFVRNLGCGTPANPAAGCSAPGLSTTLALGPGAAVGVVSLYDSSSASLMGGLVGQQIEAFDASSLELTSGRVGNAIARGNAVATLNGATVGDVDAYDSSSVVLNDGLIDGNLEAYGSASLGVNGGDVSGDVDLYDAATAVILGGILEEGVYAYDSSSVEMRGGEDISGLYLKGSATASVSGGALTSKLLTQDTSRATLRGGVFSGPMDARGASSIRVIGTNFAVDSGPVGYGPLAALLGQLSGTLESGEALDVSFTREATAAIELVPEPATTLASLAALFALAVLARWRSARRARAPELSR